MAEIHHKETLQEFWKIQCEQVAEACELMGLVKAEVPCDGWTLRQQIHRLMYGAVQNGMRLHPGKPAWFCVAEVLGVGSRTAVRICEANLFDAETGEFPAPCEPTPGGET